MSGSPTPTREKFRVALADAHHIVRAGETILALDPACGNWLYL